MSILLPPLTPLPGLPEPLWLPEPNSSTRLPVNEVHLWRARLLEEELTSPRWSGEDLEPAHASDACPVSRDRASKLKAALFRKDILERYTAPQAGPDFPTLLCGPASGLRIAVAQCDHLALIAVSRDVRGIGLDVERVRQDIPIEEMAGGFLDAHSQWDLRITWSPREKAWKFFRFWTSNEACAQARPSSRRAATTAAVTAARGCQGRCCCCCEVSGFSPEPEFIAALAIEGGPEAEVLYWEWRGGG